MSKSRNLTHSLLAVAFATLCTFIIFFLSIYIQPQPLSNISDSYTGTMPYSDLYYLTGPLECYPQVLISENDISLYTGEVLILDTLESIEDPTFQAGNYYCATLKFDIDLPDNSQHGIILPGKYSGHKLYCNGKVLSQSWPSLYRDDIVPSPRYIELPDSEDGRYSFVLQIRSPINSISGTIETIIVGNYLRINQVELFQRSIAFFLLSFLAFIIVFCFVQMISMRKDRTLTAFMNVCFVLIIYVLFYNDILIMRLFPQMPLGFGNFIRSLTKPALLISLMVYFYIFYKPLFPKNWFEYIAAILVIPVVNDLTYGNILILDRLSTLILAIPYIACFYVLLKAVKNGRSNTALLTLALSCFFYGDALVFVTTGFTFQSRHNVLPGTIIFGASQLAVLAKRYAEQDDHELEMSKELAETLEAMQSSENAFLNAQMKPHFLYNTLNTIADLCVINPSKAQALIESLKDYVRIVISIDNIEETVPLTQEVNLVRTYYKIEKERFPDIDFFEDIPLRLPSIDIPPLVLQPLVENAIKHGVRKNGKSGLIKIRIKDFPQQVEFQVSDDGIGMDRETIGKMFRVPKENKSIGIYNIDKRLNNLYGSGLRIDSNPGQGTCISFIIPKQ